MKIGISATAVLALLGQSSAFAAACSPTSCTGQISMLDIEANGDAYVALVGGLSGLTGFSPNQASSHFSLSPRRART